MKTIKIFTTLLCLLVCSSNTFGQNEDEKVTQSLAYKTGNPADWAANLDAVIAAPKNHKVLLENDKVRVLEVILLPGETENIHHHRWPSVLYIQDAGDFIDYDKRKCYFGYTQNSSFKITYDYVERPGSTTLR